MLNIICFGLAWCFHCFPGMDPEVQVINYRLLFIGTAWESHKLLRKALLKDNFQKSVYSPSFPWYKILPLFLRVVGMGLSEGRKIHKARRLCWLLERMKGWIEKQWMELRDGVLRRCFKERKAPLYLASITTENDIWHLRNIPPECSWQPSNPPACRKDV